MKRVLIFKFIFLHSKFYYSLCGTECTIFPLYLPAITMATGWPAYNTRCVASSSSGVDMDTGLKLFSPGMSAAVSTLRTPATACVVPQTKYVSTPNYLIISWTSDTLFEHYQSRRFVNGVDGGVSLDTGRERRMQHALTLNVGDVLGLAGALQHGLQLGHVLGQGVPIRDRLVGLRGGTHWTHQSAHGRSVTRLGQITHQLQNSLE